MQVSRMKFLQDSNGEFVRLDAIVSVMLSPKGGGMAGRVRRLLNEPETAEDQRARATLSDGSSHEFTGDAVETLRDYVRNSPPAS